MADVCGPLLEEVGTFILTELGAHLLTECGTDEVAETPSSATTSRSSRRARYRRVVGRRFGTFIYKLTSTITEDNY